MRSTQTFSLAGPATAWRELVRPKEHGSWSLALEPLALGLIVAPSPAGAALACSVVAAFFARRPVNIFQRDQRANRRVAACGAALTCVTVAALFLLIAFAVAGGDWIVWLIPSLALAAVFIGFDLRNAGREEMAEVAGTAAFAFLPATLAILAGWPATAALALALVMLGRAVPTVLCVRAYLRGAKTGERHPTAALASAAAAVAIGVVLARHGLAPWVAPGLLGLLMLRAIALLVSARLTLHARTLGMMEAATGVVFVVALGFAPWVGHLILIGHDG